MLAMIVISAKAAQALVNFSNSTGQSATRLQVWENVAQTVGLKAEQLRGAVQALLDTRNAFALGEPQSVGIWQLLGVSPVGDPIAIIQALRKRVQAGMDPNMMRGLLGRVGMEGIMPLLQLSEEDFGNAQEAMRGFVLNDDELRRLAKLNGEIARLRVGLTSLRNQISTGLAPVMGHFLRLATEATKKIVDFAHWLNGSSAAADRVRIGLGLVAASLTAIAVGAAILVAVLSPIALPLLKVVAIVSLLILLIDDMVTSFAGGQSLTRFAGEWWASLQPVATVLETILKTWDAILKLPALGKAGFEDFFKVFTPTQAEIDRMSAANRGAAWFAPNRNASAAGGSVNQENNVEITVNGAQGAEATGRAVGRSVKDEINSATYQMPVPAR